VAPALRLFRGIVQRDGIGNLGHDRSSFHRGQQPRKVRPIKIEYIKENVGKDQEYTNDMRCTPEYRGMKRTTTRQHNHWNIHSMGHTAKNLLKDEGEGELANPFPLTIYA